MLKKKQKIGVILVALFTAITFFTVSNGGPLSAAYTYSSNQYTRSGNHTGSGWWHQTQGAATVAPTTNSLASTTNSVASTTNNVASTTNNVASTTNNVASTTNNVAPATNNVASTTNNVAPATNVVVVDKTALTTAITAANTNAASVTVSTNGADVLPANQWVTSAVKTAYSNAIGTAQAIVANTAATQTTVNNAVTNLAAATATFNAAKTAGTATAIAGISVKDYGKAKGDGVTDDTTAINNTINYVSSKGGGTVAVPAGTYIVSAPSVYSSAVAMKSNVNLVMDPNAILKLKANNYQEYYVIGMYDVSNASVSGGQILGDKLTHTGSGGEWGHGIALMGCSGISISNTYITQCWGDGIFVGQSSDKNYCDNVTIASVNCDNNRRQGLSIISVKGITVKNSQFINTGDSNLGTPPESGIDLENDHPTEFMLNVVFQNCVSSNNGSSSLSSVGFGGYGYDMYFGGGASSDYGLPTSSVSIQFINCTGTGNYRTLYSSNATDYQSHGYNITGI